MVQVTVKLVEAVAVSGFVTKTKLIPTGAEALERVTTGLPETFVTVTQFVFVTELFGVIEIIPFWDMLKSNAA